MSLDRDGADNVYFAPQPFAAAKGSGHVGSRTALSHQKARTRIVRSPSVRFPRSSALGPTDSPDFLEAVVLGFTALTLWALTHEYRGPVLDGQIYAVQALAKLRPALNTDLFLQNTSQDQFTVFPRVYAWVISGLGLNQAALALTALFNVGFLAAAWHLTARLFTRPIAWLTVFVLIIAGGNYGASGVFHFMEPFLTARLAAEALIVTALGLHFGGFPRMAFLVAVAALFVHPLMALPGLLLLVCLALPLRIAAGVAVTGVLACWVLAQAAVASPAVSHRLPVMDAAWVDIVRERSQFLFMQLWTVKDWELNVRPFVCLALTLITLRESALRHWALCAMVVGAAGLGLATVASSVGPVAVLLQGQTWRWVWITTFVSIVLLLPTALHLWRRDALGRACAVALVAGWAFPADVGFIFVCVALLLGMAGDDPRLRSNPLARWALPAVLLSILVLALVETQAAVRFWSAHPDPRSSVVAHVRDVMGLRIWCALAAAGVYCWLAAPAPRLGSLLLALILATASTLLLKDYSHRTISHGSRAEIQAFTDWRAAIPAGSTVFVTDGHDSGSFVWFTLQRNNYLSPGQSAGVVFSRATALEVRRRSEVLQPLTDPNWKMQSALRHAASTGDTALHHHPLTAASLRSVCTDPALDFVISPSTVGFDPRPHRLGDAYRNWNLYDCRAVRSAGAS